MKSGTGERSKIIIDDLCDYNIKEIVHMNYHNITHDDMLNGSGLRVVLWCSGCEHHCNNCQNPQTWDFDSGISFDKNAKEEIFNALKKGYISGITLSGGDPLACNNLTCILDLVNEIRVLFPNKSIWIYSGYIFESIMYPVITDDFNIKRDEIIKARRNILKQCDVLVDGRYIDSQRDITLKWRGSRNQRVIDLKESFKQKQVVLYCD